MYYSIAETHTILNTSGNVKPKSIKVRVVVQY